MFHRWPQREINLGDFNPDDWLERWKSENDWKLVMESALTAVMYSAITKPFVLTFHENTILPIHHWISEYLYTIYPSMASNNWIDFVIDKIIYYIIYTTWRWIKIPNSALSSVTKTLWQSMEIVPWALHYDLKLF